VSNVHLYSAESSASTALYVLSRHWLGRLQQLFEDVTCIRC